MLCGMCMAQCLELIGLGSQLLQQQAMRKRVAGCFGDSMQNLQLTAYGGFAYLPACLRAAGSAMLQRTVTQTGRLM